MIFSHCLVENFLQLLANFVRQISVTVWHGRQLEIEKPSLQIIPQHKNYIKTMATFSKHF